MDLRSEPKISFVVASRNDDHGGDMLKRMRIFCRALLHQCKKHRLIAELIIVEWNPLPERELLHSVLPTPQYDDTLTIRYLIVPSSVHNALKNSDVIPMFQMIAKNVGIRRSHSSFVACTNVDLLFSDGLMEFLSRFEFKQNTFYRANRCDIPKSIDEGMSVEHQLEFARRNVLQRLGKNSLYPELSDTTSPVFSWPYGGWLMSLPKKTLRRLGRWSTEDVITAIDTDACGDFTMMSKADWEKIKGYFELHAYSIHLDSLALLCATAAGMKQKILDKDSVAFHISHEDGWELSDPVSKLYNDIKRPKVDWSSVYALGKRMIETQELIQVNGSDWGLRSLALKEYLFEPGMPMQVIENG